jgi:hypothetical protein
MLILRDVKIKKVMKLKPSERTTTLRVQDTQLCTVHKPTSVSGGFAFTYKSK